MHVPPEAPVDRGQADADAWGERLPRRLGLFSAVAVIVGTTIGSGIFRTPAVVAERLPQEWAFAAVWVVGGLLALAGALTFAELAAMYPRSGGIYVYIREAFGPAVAFVFGWAELLLIRPASYGAISIVCAEYTWRLIGYDGTVPVPVLGMSRAQALAALLIAVVAWINIRGVHLGAMLQNVSTVLKVAALLILVAIGLALAPDTATTAVTASAPFGLAAFGLALVSVLWVYDGFADLSFIAGEVRDPGRTLPRGLIAGTATIIVVYLAVNWVYVGTLSMAGMPGAPLVAADVAVRLIGQTGLVFITVAVAISALGSLNGSTMTGPRIFFAMAEDGLFFDGIAAVHPHYRTPARSIALMAVLGMIFVSVRTFAQLADQFIIGIWPFYAMGALALFVLRRRHPDAERPYRTLGYPWVPGLFLAAAVLLLGTYMLSEPVIFAADVAVVLAALPVYALWKAPRRS
jgi:APA family basic amino acid/polyamine antiporter